MENCDLADQQFVSLAWQNALLSMGLCIPEEDIRTLFHWVKAQEFAVTVNDVFNLEIWWSLGDHLWTELAAENTSACSLAATWGVIFKALEQYQPKNRETEMREQSVSHKSPSPKKFECPLSAELGAQVLPAKKQQKSINRTALPSPHPWAPPSPAPREPPLPATPAEPPPAPKELPRAAAAELLPSVPRAKAQTPPLRPVSAAGRETALRPSAKPASATRAVIANRQLRSTAECHRKRAVTTSKSTAAAAAAATKTKQERQWKKKKKKNKFRAAPPPPSAPPHPSEVLAEKRREERSSHSRLAGELAPPPRPKCQRGRGGRKEPHSLRACASREKRLEPWSPLKLPRSPRSPALQRESGGASRDGTSRAIPRALRAWSRSLRAALRCPARPARARALPPPAPPRRRGGGGSGDHAASAGPSAAGAAPRTYPRCQQKAAGEGERTAGPPAGTPRRPGEMPRGRCHLRHFQRPEPRQGSATPARPKFETQQTTTAAI